jgi:xanthine dehydrogenase accessory factor
MDERLFARLAAWLETQAVVVACVRETRGATPRERGSRMLISENATGFSVGGGMAEAKVMAAAQHLLAQAGDVAEVAIDLSGREGSAGVCGGTMRIDLRRWHGEDDQERAHRIAQALADGKRVELEESLYPNSRLLIVGAGHCALALHEMAWPLEFDVWVHDERESCFSGTQFAGATQLCGGSDLLDAALHSERDVYAVLLNRQFTADVAALEVLCRKPPIFIGMMGSKKRINEVLAALPRHAEALQNLHAPIGIEIEAQTPHEIAISILAQLIQQRRRIERERLL